MKNYLKILIVNIVNQVIIFKIIKALKFPKINLIFIHKNKNSNFKKIKVLPILLMAKNN